MVHARDVTQRQSHIASTLLKIECVTFSVLTMLNGANYITC